MKLITMLISFFLLMLLVVGDVLYRGFWIPLAIFMFLVFFQVSHATILGPFIFIGLISMGRGLFQIHQLPAIYRICLDRLVLKREIINIQEAIYHVMRGSDLAPIDNITFDQDKEAMLYLKRSQMFAIGNHTIETINSQQLRVVHSLTIFEKWALRKISADSIASLSAMEAAKRAVKKALAEFDDASLDALILSINVRNWDTDDDRDKLISKAKTGIQRVLFGQGDIMVSLTKVTRFRNSAGAALEPTIFPPPNDAGASVGPLAGGAWGADGTQKGYMSIHGQDNDDEDHDNKLKASSMNVDTSIRVIARQDTRFPSTNSGLSLT